MTQPESQTPIYDVFVSYSHLDREWVSDWLLPHLEAASLKGCIDVRDFEIGAPSLVNVERAVELSRKTLLILTPNWLQSEWTSFESLLLQTQDPTGLRRRLLPLLLKDCELPPRLAIFTCADFRSSQQWEAEFSRLVGQIGGSGAQPSTPKKPAAPAKISLAKLPSTSPDLFGREKELAELDAAWGELPPPLAGEGRGGGRKINVLSLVAWGGVGKTALVNKWLMGMGQYNYRGAERVFGWSFYSQGAAEGRQVSADQFIATALDWFGDPDPTQGSPWDKGERLAELVKQRRTLLVLDGLEPLQNPPPVETGRIKDPGLCCLLRELARHNPGLVVVTTRLAVEDLKDFVGSSAIERDLEALSAEAGAACLAHLGVKGIEHELRQAAEEYGGHALALTLLGRYLADVYGGDVRQRDLIPHVMDEEEEGSHARRMLAAYERWFAGKPEGAILRLLGLFDRPAEAGAIAALRADPPIDGLTAELHGLPDAKWRLALKHLRTARLLAGHDAGDPDSLDCHPLVREYFGERLEQEQPTAWGEGHNRLYEYYKAVAPQLPDTLEEMAPLYAAVAHGCQAGRHREVVNEVLWQRILRGNEHFSWKKLGAFGSDLAALSSFFDPSWSQPVTGLTEADRGWILNMAGFHLQALGRSREAAQSMQTGLEADISREDWQNAAIAASNLSELHLTLGDLTQALDYARQSVELADRSGDAFLRMGFRTTLADALHQAGRLNAAEAAFREAEAMQKLDQPQFPLLYSLRGYHYCDLLLDRGEVEEVQRRASQMLEEGKQAGDPLLDIALYHLSLGRAALAEIFRASETKGIWGTATDHLNRAVDGLRQAGMQEYLLRGLLARAALRRATGDPERAQADLDEAFSIATRGEMRRYEADCRLEFARLYLARGDKDQARASLAAARKMVEEMGYHRRDGEVRELEEQLGA